LVDVSSTGTAEQAFSELTRSCQVGGNTEAFKTGLTNSNQHCLPILVNADDPSFNISLYFPRGARGTIIITTRNPQCTFHITVGSTPVDKMDFDEATDLLLKASGANKNDQPSRDQAQPMVHLHRHIPLAIILTRVLQ